MRKAGGTSAETVDELRAELSRLAGMLPESIDLLALHKRYKAPGKVQMLSESLVYGNDGRTRVSPLLGHPIDRKGLFA